MNFISGILHNLLIKPENEAIDLFKINFSSARNQLTLIDTFNQESLEFKQNQSLFATNFQNFHLQTIKGTMLNYSPYSIIQQSLESGRIKDSNSSDPLKLFGTEGLLITEFVKKYNFSMEVKIATKWGSIFPNRTGSDLFGSLVQYDADIGLSSLYLAYPNYLLFAFSSPIRRSLVTGLAPKPRKLTSFENLRQPFPNLLWVAIISSFIIGTVVLKFSETVLQIRNPESTKDVTISSVALQIFGIMIVQPVSLKTKGVSVSIVITVFLIFGVVVSTAYSGGLASVLNIPQ